MRVTLHLGGREKAHDPRISQYCILHAMKAAPAKMPQLADIYRRRPLLASLVTVAVGATIAAVVVGMIKDLYVLPGVALAVWVTVLFALRPPVALFAMAVVFLMLDYWTSVEWLPRQLIWLPDLTLIAFCARVLYLAVNKRITYRPPAALLWTVGALALLCVVSAAIDYTSPGEVILGIRAYLRWPLLFLATLMVGLESKTMKWLLWVILTMALVQLPVTVIQWSQTQGLTDTVPGTLSVRGTTEMFLLCSYSIMIIVGLALRHRGYKTALFALAAGLVCFPPVFGFVRVSLFVTPALVLALLIYALLPRVGAKNWRNVTLVTVVIAATLAVGVGTVPAVQSAVAKNLEGLGEFGGVFGIADARLEGGAAGKLYSMRVAHDSIDDSLKTGAVGLGVGFSTSHDLISGGPKYDIPVDPKRTQVTATLLDMGYVGLLALLAIYSAVLATVPRLRGDPDKFWVAVGWAAPVAVLLAIVTLLYFAEWTSARATPVIFWMFMSAAYIRHGEGK